MTILKVRDFHNQILGFAELLIAPAFLFTRIYIANIFFKSGLTKLRDWESTLMLFEYEYEVPMLSYEVAAWLATTGELILPVLLFLGLFTRLSAIGLFIVNAVAVISLVDIPPAAFNEHVLWGSLIVMLIILGGQRFSLDRMLKIT
jgi:putative oxidoreductase